MALRLCAARVMNTVAHSATRCQRPCQNTPTSLPTPHPTTSLQPHHSAATIEILAAVGNTHCPLIPPTPSQIHPLPSSLSDLHVKPRSGRLNMSLIEPLHGRVASDVEAGPTTPAISFITKHARSLIASLSLLSTLLVAALATLTYLLLASSSTAPPAAPLSPASTCTPPTPPFLTTGYPQPLPITPADPPTPPYVPTNQQVLARIAADMDASRNLSVDPCDDFYQYACGGWLSQQVLPNGTRQLTKGFELADAENEVYIREVLEADWPIVTPFYESCMNTAAVDAWGAKPVQWFMRDLEPSNVTAQGWTKSDVFHYMGRLKREMDVTALFSMYGSWVYGQYDYQDNPRLAYLIMYVDGTTLPSSRYYYGPFNISDQIVNGVSAMFQAAGDSPSDARTYAQLAVDFEALIWRALNNQLGGEEKSEQELEDELPLERRIEKVLADEAKLGLVVRNFTFDQIAAAMPNTPFWSYVNGSGLGDVLQQTGAVGWLQLLSPSYMSILARLDTVVANAPVGQLAAYARWRALNESMPYLSSNIRLTHMQHFGAITGVESIALPDRYLECSEMVVYNLDDLFGRYFMARRLGPEMRQQARELITWIREAFERNLPEVDWMDDATRTLALAKANAMVELVGGPENGNWSDYSEVIIRRDRLYDNWFQIRALRTSEMWVQLTQPLSRGRFGMNPSLVNAQYNSIQNSITFPAGILVAPFFNYDYPMAMNLGAIGVIIGHEILHGFDNNGRQFDKDGYLRQWWPSSVITAFTRKTQCMIDQYDNIVIQGSRISGRYTLGENIADNGGVHMAYLALQWYKAQLAAYNLTDPLPPAASPLTTDQLYYWAHAQTWCTKATDAYIQLQVRYDVHSPGEARVWAPLVNQPADQFAAAFNCPVGSRMNPPINRKCDLY